MSFRGFCTTMGSFLKSLRMFLHPHFLTNIMLATVYFFLKTVVPFCSTLFEDCELELREWELLTFLGCVIVLKNRKQPSYQVYLGTVCMFAKLLSTLLFFRQNPLMGVLYTIVCFLHIAFLPEPAYSGPDRITYFRGPNLEEEIKRDPRVTWLIEFYAAWSPQCVNFSSGFAELSAKYTLDNLKFGKLDVTRFQSVSDRFRVSAASWSKQLPTLILFQGGKEVKRRPMIDSQNRIISKFIFSSDNVVRDFGLNELYNLCKKNPIKRRKAKKDLEGPVSSSGNQDDVGVAETEHTDSSGKQKTE